MNARLFLTSVGLSLTLFSAALAGEPTKDQVQPNAQSAAEARPIRVVLPAPWEPSTKQAETQSVK